MILNQIVAVAANYAIGKNNQLLWHFPEDLKFFKETTSNKIIIMGRLTYESILKPRSKPLPNRFHIVISRSTQTSPFENVIFVQTIPAAYAAAEKLILKKNYPEDVFIIGGAEIYKQTLKDTQKIYITRIPDKYEADAFYPENFIDNFHKIHSSNQQDLCFETWARK